MLKLNLHDKEEHNIEKWCYKHDKDGQKHDKLGVNVQKHGYGSSIIVKQLCNIVEKCDLHGLKHGENRNIVLLHGLKRDNVGILLKSHLSKA